MLGEVLEADQHLDATGGHALPAAIAGDGGVFVLAVRIVLADYEFIVNSSGVFDLGLFAQPGVIIFVSPNGIVSTEDFDQGTFTCLQ